MVTPYLVFNGNCAEALAFYQAVFGGAAKAPMPYGDYLPEGLDPVPENFSAWIMHAELEICGTWLWLADEPAAQVAGGGVRLTASVPTARRARAIFAALAEGGQVSLPPTETFYSSFHAAVTDRFGVNWNVVAEEAPPPPEAGP